MYNWTEAKKMVDTVPTTYIPALMEALVKRAVKDNIFKDGAARYVKHVEYHMNRRKDGIKKT